MRSADLFPKVEVVKNSLSILGLYAVHHTVGALGIGIGYSKERHDSTRITLQGKGNPEGNNNTPNNNEHTWYKVTNPSFP